MRLLGVGFNFLAQLPDIDAQILHVAVATLGDRVRLDQSALQAYAATTPLSFPSLKVIIATFDSHLQEVRSLEFIPAPVFGLLRSEAADQPALLALRNPILIVKLSHNSLEDARV